MRPVPATSWSGRPRLADLFAGLTLVADIGMGREPDTALRSCIAATSLARRAGMSEPDVHDAFYTALLLHSGCTAYAHETARLFGDDIKLNTAGSRTDFDRVGDVWSTFVPGIAPTAGRASRVRLMATVMARGTRYALDNNRATCEVARTTAARLGLSAGVQTGLFHSLESWNGRGGPQGLAGDDISPIARLVRVADSAVVFERLGGPDLARVRIRERRGTSLDPSIVDLLLERLSDALDEAATGDPRAVGLAMEPEPVVRVHPSDLTTIARAFGELVDLKSPFLHGHAAGVARLAVDAGRRLRMDEAQIVDLEVAALFHDLGRASVPSTIWEKPGPLSMADWERIRLHAYHSERILAGSPVLSRLGGTVGRHHERLDGSGYHRGADAADVDGAARIIAAADAFDAMTHDRPHRPAIRPEEAVRQLAEDVREGRLDSSAVTAVAEAAGQPAPPGARRDMPAGLTEREVEVLRTLAGGASNREIAAALSISPRTAEHHLQSIYTKIGSSSRAAAALFAMQHGLLRPDG